MISNTDGPGINTRNHYTHPHLTVCLLVCLAGVRVCYVCACPCDPPTLSPAAMATMLLSTVARAARTRVLARGSAPPLPAASRCCIRASTTLYEYWAYRNERRRWFKCLRSTETNDHICIRCFANFRSRNGRIYCGLTCIENMMIMKVCTAKSFGIHSSCRSK